MENTSHALSRGLLLNPRTTWTDIWRRKEKRLMLESLQEEIRAEKSVTKKGCLIPIIEELQSELDQILFI